MSENVKSIMLAPMTEETKRFCEELKSKSIRLDDEPTVSPPFTMEFKFTKIHLTKKMRKQVNAIQRREKITQRRIMRKFQEKKTFIGLVFKQKFM